jgi:hypothetical protein
MTEVRQDQTITITFESTDVDGNTLPIVEPVNWQVSDPSLAQIEYINSETIKVIPYYRTGTLTITATGTVEFQGGRSVVKKVDSITITPVPPPTANFRVSKPESKNKPPQPPTPSTVDLGVEIDAPTSRGQ